MATHEQTAAEEEKEIQNLKVDSLKALRVFHAAKEKNEPVNKQIKLFEDWSGKFDKLFNYVESCIATSDLLGANRSEFWAKEMANTAGNLLDTIPDFYERHWFEAKRLNLPILKPSPNAFTAMQNAVAIYNSDQVEEFIKRFQNLNLPIRGFTHPTKMNTMYDRWEKVAMLVTIIVFVAILLAVAIFKTDYTAQGFFIIRVILAIFAAAFAAVAIPGFLETTFKIGKSGAIRATGAIAVFVIVYLINPPNLIIDKKADSLPKSSAVTPPSR